MVGAGGVVPERNRGVGTNKDRSRVGDPGGDGGRIAGVHLKVFGGVRVGCGDGLLKIGGDHNGGLLTCEGRGHALVIEGDGVELLHLLIHRAGQLRRIRDEHGSRHDVVLGLGDEVVGHLGGVGRGVGEHGDLRGTGLRVDAHHRTHEALGGGDEDVAGAGDHVDGLEPLVTVGEEGHRLRTTDGPHLVHPEEGAHGKHRGVRVAAVILLRRRGHHEVLRPGGLGRNHVHDDRRRVHRLTAGNVEADAGNGNKLLCHRRTGGEGDRHIVGALRLVDGTDPPNGGVERRAEVGGKVGRRLVAHLTRNFQTRRADAVELLPILQRRLGAAAGDVFDDGPHRVQHGIDGLMATRHDPPQLSGRIRTL